MSGEHRDQIGLRGCEFCQSFAGNYAQRPKNRRMLCGIVTCGPSVYYRVRDAHIVAGQPGNHRIDSCAGIFVCHHCEHCGVRRGQPCARHFV
jgi:hypothetical protein